MEPASTYDLHCHSDASDGTLSPARLVERAADAGVGVLALTDHDTTDGLDAARQAAAARGVRLVDGAEISVTWDKRTVHIVALGIDAGNPVLRLGLQRLQRYREWRAEEIGRRLAQAGIAGTWDEARALAGGGLVGRTHFARVLAARGHAKSVAAVFKKYLVSGRPGHVPGQWAELGEAVGWIRGAGGQAVIAHPARYRLTRTRLGRLIGEFRDAGGVGIEVVSGSHSADECLTMAAQARTQKLLASVGSDYHGPDNPYVELGRLRPLPAGCEPIWNSW